MDRQYVFKVLDRSVQTSTKNYNGNLNLELKQEILIQISESKYKLPSCLLSLKAHDSFKPRPSIKEIDFRESQSVAENEITGYLKGYFGFGSSDEIQESLNNLKDILNRQPSPPVSASIVWSSFANDFKEWYREQLEPCLQQDLDLLIKYHKEI